LLLNTCLTVRAHEAGSHSNKGWEEFTDRVVDIIDRYGGANLGRGGGESPDQKIGVSRGVVFLAWGSWAQKRVARLDKARVRAEKR
jgi:uracil-DNA glycosylase